MSWPSNISSTPVEIAEREAPLLFRNKMLRPDSGGTGQFRGGLGQDICFVSVHSKPMSIVFLTERLTVPAPGIGGGSHGALAAVLIIGAAIDSRSQQVLIPGDDVHFTTPGCGGHVPKAHPNSPFS